ncbi:hypothetical protein NC652_041397 [Populus alba x Populus x berolinensis]|nr:hypothetical protein NC651_040231 [Populus alba x Populus x berolinensis]KAJ6859083.1 hypothetical protein NC652_041397 [Populus alba x Populus x berolinensis]
MRWSVSDMEEKAIKKEKKGKRR